MTYLNRVNVWLTSGRIKGKVCCRCLVSYINTFSLILLVSRNAMLLVVCQLSRHTIGCEEYEGWLVRFDWLAAERSRSQINKLAEPHNKKNTWCLGNYGKGTLIKRQRHWVIIMKLLKLYRKRETIQMQERIDLGTLINGLETPTLTRLTSQTAACWRFWNS